MNRQHTCLLAILLGLFLYTRDWDNVETRGFLTQFPGTATVAFSARVASTAPPPPHPRLLFGVDSVATLRKHATTTHQAIWAPVQAYIEETRNERAPAAAPADGQLSDYRNWGNRLLILAFACLITQEPSSCNPARDQLLTQATWRQWGEEEARDLGHAHMLLGHALAYDWLYPLLTPVQRTQVQQSLGDWAEKMDEASRGDKVDAWRNWWSKSYAQNHYWINHSALGMAGLALLGDDPRAETWVDHAAWKLTILRDLLNNIGDGSWHEGLHYQSYGLTLLAPFWLNVRALQQGDLLPAVYLRNYIDWRLYNYIPGAWEPALSFGDYEAAWGDAYAPTALLRLLANEYQNGHAEWLAQQLLTANPRSDNIWSTPWYVFEFFYYNPTIAPAPPTDLPPARTFPDLEGIIWRSSWQDDALIVGLKTGGYGGRFLFDSFVAQQPPWEAPCLETRCELNFGHDHDDANSFFLSRGQPGFQENISTPVDPWLAPEIIGVEKTDTALHNTILIDGQGQLRPPPIYRDPNTLIGSDGFLETTASVPGFDYAAADATRRYRQFPDLRDVTRHLLFVRPDYLLMVDRLAATSPHRYTWVSHFGQSIQVEDRWVRGTGANGQLLGVGLASAFSQTITTGNDGRPYVWVQNTKPMTVTRFIHLLWPNQERNWANRPQFHLSDEDKNGLLLRVQRLGDNRGVEHILLNDAGQGKLVYPGPYQFDGEVAVLTFDDDKRLQRLFLFGGTFIQNRQSGLRFVDGVPPSTPLAVLFSDQEAQVAFEGAATLTLYAPDVQKLLVNGVTRPFTRAGQMITFETTTN